MQTFTSVLFVVLVASAAVLADERDDSIELLRNELLVLKSKVAVLEESNGGLNQLAKDIIFSGREKRAATSAVGFSARMLHDKTGLHGETLNRFPTIYTNAGNAFNTETGVFTAPVAGLYAFYLNVHKTDSTSRTYCYLMMNGHVSTLAYADHGDPTDPNKFKSASAFIVYQMAAGGVVNVGQCNGDIFFETNFSGFLISRL